jgi:hypothetical protein
MQQIDQQLLDTTLYEYISILLCSYGQNPFVGRSFIFVENMTTKASNVELLRYCLFAILFAIHIATPKYRSFPTI